MKDVFDQIQNQKDHEANWLKQQGQLNEALRIHNKYSKEEKSTPPLFIKGVSFIAQIISFLLAAFLPISFIIDLHNNKGFVIVLLVASILLLGLIELSKRFSLERLLAKHYNTKKYSSSLIFFIVLLGLVSAFTSTLGGAKWGEYLADQSNSIKLNYTEERKKVNDDFENAILKINQETKEYINSVSYKGKINISNLAVRKKLTNVEDRKAVLEKERVSKLNDLSQLEQEALSDNSENFQFWESIAMSLSILFEVTLWLSLFYCYSVESKFAEKIAGKISYQLAHQNQQMNNASNVHVPQQGAYSISAFGPPKVEEKKEESRIGFSAPLPDKNQKVCLTCGRSFKAKHPSQKFCCNKGDGNCKDKYNNEHRPHYTNPGQSELDFSNSKIS
ncbi:hypothetical protein [Flammeovirga sp. OC4]|uniref:hypothetical protein n=1 Tax=Flammeovirga sp. OC4 TaxID=1382345 RepID=UPI0005C6187B|nr:hypothetical protein [Flammeovirga sp. OC4]